MEFWPEMCIKLRHFVINTVWKVSVFGVFLVCIFPHSNWIRRDIYANVSFPYLQKMVENQKFSNVFRGYKNGLLACNGYKITPLRNKHWVKSVRIGSFSGPYSVQMSENMDQQNCKYGYFHVMKFCSTMQCKVAL